MNIEMLRGCLIIDKPTFTNNFNAKKNYLPTKFSMELPYIKNIRKALGSYRVYLADDMYYTNVATTITSIDKNVDFLWFADDEDVIFYRNNKADRLEISSRIKEMKLTDPLFVHCNLPCQSEVNTFLEFIKRIRSFDAFLVIPSRSVTNFVATTMFKKTENFSFPEIKHFLSKLLWDNLSSFQLSSHEIIKYLSVIKKSTLPHGYDFYYVFAKGFEKDCLIIDDFDMERHTTSYNVFINYVKDSIRQGASALGLRLRGNFRAKN